MNAVRWGMIGCGSVAERKSGPAFYKAPGSALVAVMGRRLDAVSDYAARHGIARVYTDVDALMQLNGITNCAFIREGQVLQVPLAPLPATSTLAP